MVGTVAENLTPGVHVLAKGERVGPFHKALCGAPMTRRSLVSEELSSVTCEGCHRRHAFNTAKPIRDGKGQ